MREIIEKKGEEIGEGTERKGRDDEKCVKASEVKKKKNAFTRVYRNNSGRKN